MLNEIKEALPQSWISLIIIVIIGALGSATWDVLLKPTLIKIRNFLLSFFTLWKDNLKGEVYTQISYGSSKQHISLYNSGLLLTLFTTLVFVLIFSVKHYSVDRIEKLTNDINKTEQMLKKATNIEKSKEEETVANSMSIFELKERIQTLLNAGYGILFFIVLMGVYFIGSSFSNLIRMKYIHEVTCYLDGLFRVIRPYVSSKIYNKLQSQYALIKTKDDYSSLISQLKVILEDENIKYAEFSAW